jgi:hypothetical protein
MPRVSTLVLGAVVVALSACTEGAPVEPEGTAEVEPPPARIALALSAADPVGDAVGTSCTTTAVKGLSAQLVAEIQCMRPGSMKSLEGAAGLSLGSAVFPYLQTPAAEALLAAQKARGKTMSINSALRTLPQQYLLYRWYKTKRCGITLAAEPGKSNHETAVALDLADAQAWRPSMTSAGFRWLGASDPVHFDYTGPGAIEMRGLSVTVFQRLWNRNHPEDLIAEDGDYGAETEKRLARAPVGGFPRGAEGCEGDAGPPSTGLGAPGAPPAVLGTPDAVPDAAEPSEEGDSGCSVTATPRAGETRGRTVAMSASLLALVVLGARARRRASRAPGRLRHRGR